MNPIIRRLQLSLALAKAEFKERNEGSYLGVLWYLLNPLLLFLLLLLVFADRVGNRIPDYPLYLLTGIIMFNFFQRATIDSTKVIREHRYLIKSVNFPRQALVGSIVLRTLYSHLFEILLLAVFLFIFQGAFVGIVFYPFILLFFYAFIFGTSLILASLTIYIMDIEHVWAFAARLIWLGTPIFYAIAGQTRLAFVSRFNPMYYYITIARDVMVYGQMPQAWMVFGAVGYGIVFLAAGLMTFKNLKTRFAELV